MKVHDIFSPLSQKKDEKVQENHMITFSSIQSGIHDIRISKTINFDSWYGKYFPSSIFDLEFCYSIATEYIIASFKKEGETKKPFICIQKSLHNYNHL